MSDGGIYPWKRQRTKVVKIPDYSLLQKPLPPPPKGKQWHYDPATREWSVVEDSSETARSNNNNNNNNSSSLVASPTDPSLSFGGMDHDTTTSSQGVVVVVGQETKTMCLGGGSPTNSTMEPNDDLLDDQVEYVEHVVHPSDTFQGICLAYNISASKLRQANCFSGTNLLLAPSTLKIPISLEDLRRRRVRPEEIQRQQQEKQKRAPSKDEMVEIILAQFPKLHPNEARAYLELADWDLNDAIQELKDEAFSSSELFQLLPGENNSNPLYGSTSSCPHHCRVLIVAPANLPANFQFVISLATTNNSTVESCRSNNILVQVPNGGVKRGEQFEPILIPKGLLSYESGLDSVYYPPAGRWKEDECDCAYRGFAAENCLGCCCPHLLLGQVQTRMKLPPCWGWTSNISNQDDDDDICKGKNKDPGTNYKSHPLDDYPNDSEDEISSFDVYFLLTVLAVVVVVVVAMIGGGNGIGYEYAILQGICLIILIGTAIACTRTTLRHRYGIPGSICSDCICSFCCTCCVVTQMARHTANYKQTPANCCSRLGLFTKYRHGKLDCKGKYVTANVGFMRVKVEEAYGGAAPPFVVDPTEEEDPDHSHQVEYVNEV